MKGGQGKRDRQVRAIEVIEGQIAQHEKGVELVKRVLEEKNTKLPIKTQDELEKIRKKKLEKAKTVLENTKKKMK